MVSAAGKTIVIREPVLKIGCVLGEGPLYEPSTATLHFVDIVERKVYHFNTVSRAVAFDVYDVPITSLALRRNAPGKLAGTTAQGFALLGSASSLRYLSRPITAEDIAFTRFNDGACDNKGRFLAGTIHSPEHDIPGKLYRYEPSDGSCVIIDHGPFTDTNGMGWSLDAKTFYLTDSMVNLIYAYDYEDGNLSNRRVLVDANKLGYGDSYCDGLCIDTEGGIWSARWGGSRVVRFTSSGTVDLEIFFPTALNVTSCCFGGPENDQLYVTSAHCGAVPGLGDAGKQTEFPNSGDLFVVDLAGRYRGVPRHTFAG